MPSDRVVDEWWLERDLVGPSRHTNTLIHDSVLRAPFMAAVLLPAP
jgi:hypothetical protein